VIDEDDLLLIGGNEGELLPKQFKEPTHVAPKRRPSRDPPPKPSPPPSPFSPPPSGVALSIDMSPASSKLSDDKINKRQEIFRMKQEARAQEREEARRLRDNERKKEGVITKVAQRNAARENKKRGGWNTGNQDEVLNTLRSKMQQSNVNVGKKKEGINTLVSRLDQMREDLRSGAGGARKL